MKKFVFSVGFVAVATSTVWAQNDRLPAAPGGIRQGYYYEGPYSPQPSGPAYYGVDPTAHYWDYYPEHDMAVDRTTPP